MQTSGGYRYPSTKILLAFLAVTGLGIAAVWFFRRPGLPALLVLALGTVGSILMAGAFTAVGLVPPQGTFMQRITWFLKPQFGTAVQLNQPFLYAGLMFVLAALFVSATPQ